MLAALLAPAKAPAVDLSAHMSLATGALWLGLGCAVAFFLVRPELWRRLWLERVDPRPAGLFRIVFGVVVLWTLLDLIPLLRFLFTDEGLWLPAMARKNYGGELRRLWDPEYGFESWWSVVPALWAKFSLFHLRADPAFVWAVFGLTCASVTAMILGVKTRLSTLLSWFLVNTFYSYSPVFYSGGDTVLRVFLFLGLLTRWGEAYSLDAWWRRKRELLGGSLVVPALRKIPAWPLRLMMLQLAIIYCATGALKSGLTWFDGTALYYALSLDHFYRHPVQIQIATFLHWIGFLPLSTWVTKAWETLFPLALVGVALRRFEREVSAGTWPKVQAWRRLLSYALIAAVVGVLAYVGGLTAWYYYSPGEAPVAITRQQAQALVVAGVLAFPALLLGAYSWLRARRPRAHAWVLRWLCGKRLWLGLGVVMHLVIDVAMNVGTFVQVMLAVYIPWLSASELDAVWRTLMSRPLGEGEGDRPKHKPGWKASLLRPLDRLRYRGPREPYVVHHAADEASIRRVALLRMWDLGARLRFETDPSVPAGALVIVTPDVKTRQAGAEAGRALVPILPGFWWLYPWCLAPGLRTLAGRVVLRTFELR
ncbi:hypothetical protein OV079_37805 [Nannocystis pusilla]|uniref:HTTM-like domain-containing protein n=1 Tax=Nannocystis pusilla TaxID=889268 RepID=A0A9X3J1Z5_9BACT|nr:hypothetical protein [Nannocystis pusilla]MCY1011219.1 hypothetical protein [Nannocystis pusilla]